VIKLFIPVSSLLPHPNFSPQIFMEHLFYSFFFLS